MKNDKLLSTGSLATATGLDRMTVRYWLNKLKIEPADTVGFGKRIMRLYDKSTIDTIQTARGKSRL